MGIADLFRKKVSRTDCTIALVAAHKEISRTLFFKFREVLLYKNELDALVAFKEIEYLVFWFLRRHLNDGALIDMYNKFLEGSKMSTDGLVAQLDIRYGIYDEMLKGFTGSQFDNPSSQGLQVGQILVKSIGNLNIMKNGTLGDGQDSDLAKVFKVFSIWFEGLKVVDGVIGSAKHKYKMASLLRDS